MVGIRRLQILFLGPLIVSCSAVQSGKSEDAISSVIEGLREQAETSEMIQSICMNVAKTAFVGRLKWNVDHGLSASQDNQKSWQFNEYRRSLSCLDEEEKATLLNKMTGNNTLLGNAIDDVQLKGAIVECSAGSGNASELVSADVCNFLGYGKTLFLSSTGRP